MAIVAEITDFGSKNTRAHAFRTADSKRRSRAKPAKTHSTSRLLEPRDCIICGDLKCTVVTHRIAILQVLKRSAKASKNGSNERPVQSSVHSRLPVKAPQSRVSFVKSPCAAGNIIDPFAEFPVHGASKDTMRRFHDFFTQQGDFVTNSTRGLVFDQRGFAGLYPAAMQNPALCMSVVALATSYKAVHFHDRVAPDVETLSVHNQAFEMIRAQIDEQPTPQLIEFTVSAVHRLAMACGIAFGDADASVTHWNGVLALLDRYPYLRLSGGVMGYVTQMEYWVAINPGIKPRSEDWPIPFAHENLPAEKYGQDFQELCGLPSFPSEISSKLLSVSLTTCRATEILEIDVAAMPSHLSRPSPYFMHLFDVLLRQQSQLYTTLLHRNDIAECVCITLNLYFMIVIRCTPWRAPLAHLCVRLKDVLAVCKGDFGLEFSSPASAITKFVAIVDETTIMRNLYLWMLIVCACALQLCRDRSCQDWVLQSLREVCQDDISLENESREAEILRRVKRFCWSDTFLLCRFKELCNTVHR